MVSESSMVKGGDQVEVQPPAYGGDSDDKDTPIPILDGLYILTNKMARTVLDLWHPKTGTQCQGWSQHTGGGIANQLWIICKNVSRDNYTLNNLHYARFLDLLAGNPDNGAYVIGCVRVEGSLNQEWRIVEHIPHFYTLQCERTNTFLEIPGGNSANGTKTTCSAAASEKDCQLWQLDRVSRSGVEIRAIVEQWKPELLPRVLLPHGDAAEYFVLPGAFRRALWEQTNLQRQQVRPHMFDYDIFVIKSKEVVHSWARDTFPAEIPGFGILFGIIYGEARKGPKAYNWYLTEDMRSLVFFDPQTGREYSTAALDDFGFEPVFATF